MSTLDANAIPELDSKGLRDYALTMGAIIAGLFGGLLPWALGAPFPLWPWLLAGALAVWGFIAPRSLRPLYRGWMRFGLMLNRVTTPLILSIVFYLIITPMGLAMRLFRRDPMARRFDRDVPSYRVASRKPRRENMERPF